MILKFVNSINQEIDFMSKQNAHFFGGNLLDYAWNVDASALQFGNRIKRFTKGAISFQLELLLSGSDQSRKNALNELFEISDYDVTNKKAGRLYFNEYYIESYILNVSVKSKVSIGADTIVKATVYCPNPFWRKEETTSFNINTTGTTGGHNLDYNHDFPFDFTTSLNVFTLNNQGYAPSDFRIIFYGYIENPSINIGNHTYKVNATVGAKEYLEINSIDKTITLVKQNGEKLNLFNNRYRDSYIFEKIPTGVNNVSWADDFRFDITLIEQRSEPKWI